jgi:predicted lysophospholipase L1 biosynthesis ABC-type transport system permease subunit
VRRLTYEAADSGLLSPELGAGIRRVKGVKQLALVVHKTLYSSASHRELVALRAISYLVNEQSREIAIRFALGAQRRDILRMVLRQGLTLAAAGAVAGLVGALIVSHLMASLLYGVSPYDLSTFAGVTAVLTAIAIAASYGAPCASIRSLHSTSNDFGTARDLSSQVVSIPNDRPDADGFTRQRVPDD